MSFDINWDQLVEDGNINNSIKAFLDEQFGNLSLPSFINHLSVTDFTLGSIAPEITVRHIGDPFDEFYKDDEEDEGKNEHALNVVISEQDSSDEEVENDTSEMEVTTDIDQENISKQEQNDSTVRPHRTDSLPILNLGYNPQSFNVGLHGVGAGGVGGISDGPGTPVGASVVTAMGTAAAAAAAAAVSNPGSAHPFIDPSHHHHHHHPYPYLRTISNPILNRSMETTSIEKSENDIQFTLELKYSGDLHVELKVDLLVNYPSPNFITLPIKLHITDIDIHSIMVVAYLKNSVYTSFLCDIDDSETFNTTAHGSNIVDYTNFTGSRRERVDIIRKIKIESEIGEVESNVLRNVGKVEKFLVEQLRSILRDEVAWPSWLCFDMSKDEGKKDNSDKETEAHDNRDILSRSNSNDNQGTN